MFETDYFDWEGYEFVRTYEFAGYGKDAQAIYSIFDTKYSVAEGVIYDHKLFGYCDTKKAPAILVNAA